MYSCQFACVSCHGLKFKDSVVELSTVRGLNTDAAREKFLDLPYLNTYPALFLQLDRNWCCHTCQKAVDSGQMPHLAARNSLATTWAALPPGLRKLSHSELEIVGLARVSILMVS